MGGSSMCVIIDNILSMALCCFASLDFPLNYRNDRERICITVIASSYSTPITTMPEPRCRRKALVLLAVFKPCRTLCVAKSEVAIITYDDILPRVNMLYRAPLSGGKLKMGFAVIPVVDKEKPARTSCGRPRNF